MLKSILKISLPTATVYGCQVTYEVIALHSHVAALHHQVKGQPFAKGHPSFKTFSLDVGGGDGMCVAGGGGVGGQGETTVRNFTVDYS